jgi:hypothetical protein
MKLNPDKPVLRQMWQRAEAIIKHWRGISRRCLQKLPETLLRPVFTANPRQMPGVWQRRQICF